MLQQNNNLVSIIIPAFNSAAFIEETLRSVLRQSWPAVEIIVVDDGSTDATVQVVRKIADERITIFEQRNLGACAARNKGYQESSGAFLQFLDADDLLSPNKIEEQVQRLQQSGDPENYIANGRWGRFYHSPGEDIHWGPDKSLQKDLTPINWLLTGHMSMTGCWLTPRKLIEKTGLWNEALLRNQDGEFFSRLVARSAGVLYCPGARVYYRSGLEGSVSRRNSETACASHLQSLHIVAGEMLHLEQSARVNKAIASRFVEFAQSHYIQFPMLSQQAQATAKQFGGGFFPLKGSAILKTVEWLFGWKAALSFKHWMTRKGRLRAR